MTLRCEITGNECGTDTWAVGKPCQCAPCREFVAEFDKLPEIKVAGRVNLRVRSVKRLSPPNDDLTEAQKTANRHALTGVVGP